MELTNVKWHSSDGTHYVAEQQNMRVLFLTIGPWHQQPWWWKYLPESTSDTIDYKRITFWKFRSSDLPLVLLPVLLLRILFILLNKRSQIDYIVTFECDWAGLMISFLQAITRMRYPRHVIVQFIMREKSNTLTSRIKYMLMRFGFSSVYSVICSAQEEAEYYCDIFGWPKAKARFIPYHTDPGFLQSEGSHVEEGLIVAAGRTFRDYETLFAAVAGLDINLHIVAGRGGLDGIAVPTGVTISYDIPLTSLIELIKKSHLVVLPLEDRRISVGQSVLLQAMTIGKPVVVTKTAGTKDYVDHMSNGIFVRPGEPSDLREAIGLIRGDAALARRLGTNARKRIEQRHLPQHYFGAVLSSLDRVGR